VLDGLQDNPLQLTPPRNGARATKRDSKMQTVWNTERLYTEDGQIIAARYVDGVVCFADVSRMIDGTFVPAVPIVNERQLQSLVLHRYDHGNYERMMDTDTRDQLAALAKTIA
jgi:hypothetical protein